MDPFLEQQLANAALLPPLNKVPIGKIRATDAKHCSTGLPLAPVDRIRDLYVPGPRHPLRLRLYYPQLAQPSPAPPVTVFFHGGGFVICSIESHDEICRHICHLTGSLVVSVNYSLAPEDPHPAAPNDCFAATDWVFANIGSLGGNPRRLALAGDSAGGNLATVTAMQLRDRREGVSIAGQLLLYPVTDHYSAKHPSYDQCGEGYGLTHSEMTWFWDLYLPDACAAESPLVSPLRAPNLADMPPTLVITGEYDLLRDEGEAYARRLKAAGVQTEMRRYPDVNHGFMFWVGLVDSATEAMNFACTWLASRLAVLP